MIEPKQGLLERLEKQAVEQYKINELTSGDHHKEAAIAVRELRIALIEAAKKIDYMAHIYGQPLDDAFKAKKIVWDLIVIKYQEPK